MVKNRTRNLLLVLAVVFAAALVGAVALWNNPKNVSAESAVAEVTGQKDSVEGAVTLTSFTMKEGAEVRKSGVVGLRFTANVTSADLAELPKNAEFGMLLLPEEYLGAAELTPETANVLKVPAVRWYAVDGDNYSYTAVLVGKGGAALEEAFYGVNIVARAYVSYVDASNTTHVNYAANEQTRSAAYVASAALANDESDEEGVLANIAGTAAKDFACTETDISVKAGKSVKPVFTGDNDLVIKYETANAEIAVVENGEIKGVAEGTTKITASIGTAKVEFNVTVNPATVIESDKTAYDLIFNSETEKSAALVVKCDGAPIANDQIEWTSSAPEVVSVADGTVTALASGSATVTAKYDGATLDFTITAWQGIYSTEEFNSLYVLGENMTGNYKLMADISRPYVHDINEMLIGNLLANNLTGVFDGNNHTIYDVETRLFNGVKGGEVRNLNVVTKKMSIWGGIFGYELNDNAVVDNVTAHITFGYSLTCNNSSQWGTVGASGFAYTAKNSTIKNSNIYIIIPEDLQLKAWDADTAPNWAVDKGLYAIAYGVEDSLKIENTNAYYKSYYAGAKMLFAGGFEIAVQAWDGFVEVSTVDDLSLYGNAGLNVKLMNDLTVEFAGESIGTGSLPSGETLHYVNANVIEVLNSVIDGNDHTITINAYHKIQNNYSDPKILATTHQNLVKEIGVTGVLKNTKIIYNLYFINGVQNAYNASMLTSTNKGTMQNLDVTFNFVDNSALNCWFNENSGYLSWDGTGTYLDMTIRLTGSHLFLRSAEQPDGEYGRCGIVNANGDAATVTNMTIYGVEAAQPIGLLAPTWRGIVNGINATGLTAIKDIPA